MKTGLTALAAPLAAALMLAAAPAAAQTAAPAAEPGIAIADVGAWLTSKGGEVGPVRREGDETFFMVKDGPLNWALFFYGCQADVCGDIQFSAVFSNPGVTLDKVNEWNRDQRFLKAFYMPGAAGAAPSAAIQYDVLIHQGSVEQLNDPAAVWIGLLGIFATHIGYLAPAPAAAPPAQ
jgi:hypothetical protein